MYPRPEYEGLFAALTHTSSSQLAILIALKFSFILIGFKSTELNQQSTLKQAQYHFQYSSWLPNNVPHRGNSAYIWTL